MKISKETKDILKNFAEINPGILFNPGNVIRTMSPQGNIFAYAKVSETIPTKFAIYDLHNFLLVNSLFKDDSELEFDDKHVIIKGISGRSKIKYRFTDESMIVAAPDKTPKLPNVNVKFTLSKTDYDWLEKSAKVLSSPNIAVECDGEKVNILVYDEKDDSSHTNSLELSEVEHDNKLFKFVFKTENLRFISDTYCVEICKDGISSWTSTTQELVYFVALETASKYQG